MRLNAEQEREIALQMESYNLSRWRTVCPVCNGGSTRESSLSVSMHGSTMVYKCWRMKCGVHSGTSFPASTPKKSVRLWEKETYPLSPLQMARMRALAGSHIGEKDISLSDNRVVMNVRSYEGRTIGRVLRSYDWLAKLRPKSINVIEDNSVAFIHFPDNTRRMLSDSVVCVEDWCSAEKLSHLYPTVSLQGTDFRHGFAEHLAELGIRHLHIALDNDAIAKQYKIKKQIDFFFECVTLHRLQKDIKDMNDKELQEFYSAFNP